MAKNLFEIKDVRCGSCLDCVLGNRSLAQLLAEYYPEWKPGIVTQLVISGTIDKNRLRVNSTYSPTKLHCKKEVFVYGPKEDAILEQIMSLLKQLARERLNR